MLGGQSRDMCFTRWGLANDLANTFIDFGVAILLQKPWGQAESLSCSCLSNEQCSDGFVRTQLLSCHSWALVAIAHNRMWWRTAPLHRMPGSLAWGHNRCHGTSLFTQFTLPFSDWARETHQIPPSMDSGGGSLCHLNTDFTLLYFAWSFEALRVANPIWLQCHAKLSRISMLLLTKKWDAIRASGCDPGHFGALDGVHVGQRFTGTRF